jgi:anthranilate synthase component 1
MTSTKNGLSEIAPSGRIFPLYKTFKIKGLSPNLAWLRVCSTKQHSFLLESIEGEEKVARYSFLGWDPFLIFRSKGHVIELCRGAEREVLKGDPIKILKELIDEFSYEKDDSLPKFSGGAVGYIGYDVVRFFEDLPDENPDDIGLPDCCLIFPRMVLVFDHKVGLFTIVMNIGEGSRGELEGARKKIEEVISALKRPYIEKERATVCPQTGQKIESNCTQSEFETMVDRAKEYIKAGDVFQVVLSQRLNISSVPDPFRIYRVLRVTNPSPYMYYLNFDELKIVGSSPEILVRVTDGKVETRPLAGTRPRGSSAKDDAVLINDLLHDEKERAEHIMLVDLGRNDIGRVCEHGSVQVTELLDVEKYSHVIHLVSEVIGTLRSDKDVFDVLRATFPAGTVSGAPKIRAMEIIDELEPSHRGIYAGAIGYVSFTGNLDTCIAIRTIVIKDGKAYIQAGAGIVADSVPEREYRETIHKAQALLRAVEIAQAQPDAYELPSGGNIP